MSMVCRVVYSRWVASLWPRRLLFPVARARIVGEGKERKERLKERRAASVQQSSDCMQREQVGEGVRNSYRTSRLASDVPGRRAAPPSRCAADALLLLLLRTCPSLHPPICMSIVHTMHASVHHGHANGGMEAVHVRNSSSSSSSSASVAQRLGGAARRPSTSLARRLVRWLLCTPSPTCSRCMQSLLCCCCCCSPLFEPLFPFLSFDDDPRPRKTDDEARTTQPNAVTPQYIPSTQSIPYR